ncbi:MAG TPA: hypothetical protein VK550_27145 [Polyangiaceae bacterium]|nr:hypothetical protein [Polyangiaceae bacterium]
MDLRDTVRTGADAAACILRVNAARASDSHRLRRFGLTKRCAATCIELTRGASATRRRRYVADVGKVVERLGADIAAASEQLLERSDDGWVLAAPGGSGVDVRARLPS